VLRPDNNLPDLQIKRIEQFVKFVLVLLFYRQVFAKVLTPGNQTRTRV